MKVTFRDDLDAKTKEIEYKYDAFDRRIAKILDSNGNGTVDSEEHFVYDGSDIVLQYDAAGSLTHRYLHGPAVDQVLADEDDLGDVLWPLADNQGTVRDLVDDNGDVQNHLTYDAFGKITSESDDTVDHLYAYTGREWDADAELYYYRARWYDPTAGRFLSEDPIGFFAGDASLSRYVFNSPANLSDPTGLYGWVYDFFNWKYGGDYNPPFARPHGVNSFDTLVIQDGKTTAGNIMTVSSTGGLITSQGDAFCNRRRPIGQMGGKVANDLVVEGALATVGGGLGRYGDDVLDVIFNFRRQKGLFNLGEMAAEHANQVGRAWVGPNARPIFKNDKVIGYISQDSTKVYRFPALKKHGVASGRVQANLSEVCVSETGRRTEIRNGHIDIIPSQ